MIPVTTALLITSQPALAEFSQQWPKLVGTGATVNALQGTSVALSWDGKTAIVGGSGDKGGLGAAWVWTLNGGVWTQGGKLVGEAAIGPAQQGKAVALSRDGGMAIVGGPEDNGDTGAAWVFIKSAPGVWVQLGSKLVGKGAIGPANQGESVALSEDGSTAIVGGHADNGNTGAAWVFTRSGNKWIQQGSKLVGEAAIGPAQQGYSVALSPKGDAAIVGGNRDDNYKGAAWVYTRNGDVWTLRGKLIGTGAIGTLAQQGVSVALSSEGKTAIVGGWGDDGNKGAAWVYTRSGNIWTQQGSKLFCKKSAIGPGACGYSVALSYDGNTAILGGYADNGGLFTSVGAAWVYTRQAGVWNAFGGKLVGTATAPPSRQGYSVSLSGDGKTAIVGGPKDNGDNGAAWVFVR